MWIYTKLPCFFWMMSLKWERSERDQLPVRPTQKQLPRKRCDRLATKEKSDVMSWPFYDPQSKRAKDEKRKLHTHIKVAAWCWGRSIWVYYGSVRNTWRLLFAVLLPYFLKLALATEGVSDLCGVERPRLLQAWGGPKFSASCISGSAEEVKNGVGVKQCWGGARQRVEEMHEFKRLSD